MKKILSAISGKLAEEATKTIEEGSKRLTNVEKLGIMGVALIGLAVVSAYRKECNKKAKGAKTPH